MATTHLTGQYLAQMQAHVDDGGTLTHQNAVDLLKEVWRLRAMDGQKYHAALQEIEYRAGGSTVAHIHNKWMTNVDLKRDDINSLLSIIKDCEGLAISGLSKFLSISK